MKILQFVSYVSADGAFGGPVAVAVTQARELARAGHEVVLLAGWDGIATLRIPGVKVVLARVERLPGLGFSGLRSRRARSWLKRHAREFDVVHVHAGRHLIDIEVALLARRLGVRYLMQTHGMIMPSTSLMHRLVDRLLTRKAVARSAAVLALTTAEEHALRNQFPRLTVSRIRNGITPRSTSSREVPSGREREVVFLARLHPRKRVLAFAEMAEIVARRHPDVRFVVIGPDEGDLAALLSFMTQHPDVPIRYEGALAPGLAADRLAATAALVLPSLGEVFPMTVLEAFSVQTPVVITKDCGIADELRALDAALVTDGSPTGLAEAVDGLLTDPSERARLDLGMRTALSESYSIGATAQGLVHLYTPSEDSASCPSVVWLTNAAPPYRLPVWDALARDVALEVWLLESDQHMRHDDNNRGDDWAASHRLGAFAMRSIPSHVIHRGEARHYLSLWIRPAKLEGATAIVIGGWDSPAYWLASWSAKMAGVRRVGFYESHRLSQTHPRGAVTRLRRAFFRGMDEIVVPGIAARDALLGEGIDPARIRVGFNAVDVERIHRETEAARERLTHNTGSEGHRLLCVSQLIPRKNVASLIEAIAVPELSDCTLTVVGTGKEDAALHQEAERLGVADRVLFAGYVPSAAMPQVFASHDLLVHPATQEVWGLAVNEALAAGLPVLVGRNAGVTPSIQHMVGVHTTNGTPEDLRAKLEAVLPAALIDGPQILANTPERFAETFREAFVPAAQHRADLMRGTRPLRRASSDADGNG